MIKLGCCIVKQWGILMGAERGLALHRAGGAGTNKKPIRQMGAPLLTSVCAAELRIHS